MPASFLGAGLALLAALLFAMGMQFTQLGLRTVDSQRGTLITIASSTAVYWFAAPWYLKLEYWSSSVVWLFLLVGLFRPFLSSNLSLAGTVLLGPTISSTVASTAPFFGLFFGVFVLGEALTVSTVGGTVAIVAGVVVLAGRRAGHGRPDWPMWALLLPIGAAVIRVTAHLLSKVGMEELPSVYFVGLVSYTASLAVALGNNARRKTSLRPLARMKDSRWFVVAGLFFGAAVLMLNIALRHGELSVVTPIVSSEPIFVLLLGIVFFHERQITVRVGCAAALMVVGVALISARAGG